MHLFWIIIWLVLSLFVGVYASGKGRSGVLFFILAIFLSPLVAFFIAFAVSDNEKQIEAKSVKAGDKKKCPYCAELVKVDAEICKHCGKSFPVDPIKAAQDSAKALESERDILVNVEGFETVGDLEDYAVQYGYSKAKYTLGMLYLIGEKIEKDIEKAKYWLQQSANEGFGQALEELKRLD